jgi:hypothetical protein
MYVNLGSTTVFAADGSTGDVSIDTSDLGGTTTVKGDTTDVTSTSHTIVSSGDSATGNVGDIAINQVFYGLSETRLLVDTDGGMYANPEIDMGYNLFKTTATASNTPNALFTLAGSNNPTGVPVTSGVERKVVDITLDDYRACWAEVIMEIVFDDAVAIWHGQYLLYYSGGKALLNSNTAMTDAYSDASATLSHSVTYADGTFTFSVTYTKAGSSASAGLGYSMVEIKGGYKSYAVYNT